MKLVVRMTAKDRYAGLDVFEYPSEHSMVHSDPTWLKIVDQDGVTVAVHKTELVSSAYRVEDEPVSEVPTDTRLNHTTLARDSKGRFVGKAKV